MCEEGGRQAQVGQVHLAAGDADRRERRVLTKLHPRRRGRRCRRRRGSCMVVMLVVMGMGRLNGGRMLKRLEAGELAQLVSLELEGEGGQQEGLRQERHAAEPQEAIHQLQGEGRGQASF